MTFHTSEGTKHPKIYGYTLPKYKDTEWSGKRTGKGLVKVGYTDRDVRTRLREQLNPVKMPTERKFDLLLVESAISPDGVAFTDHDVHRALVQAGVHRVEGEWFECTKDEVLSAIHSVREGAVLPSLRTKAAFGMRPEQHRAVDLTSSYFFSHKDDEVAPSFLWNAKMRFGKTFTAYQLAKRMGWSRVIVLTYKPAAGSAWRDDLDHVDFEGWRFKGRDDGPIDPDDPSPLVWFASFQDVLGTDGEGNPKPKNEDIHLIDWDCVIVDEYHFGAWRDTARSLYIDDSSEKEELESQDLSSNFRENLRSSLSVKNYLFLSGTPFRALIEGEFLEEQIFNWTYRDEQKAKAEWKKENNPYISLPKMHLLVYQMPESLIEIARTSEATFSLTEFFKAVKVDGVPKFVHEKEVQKWLDLLRGQNLSDFYDILDNKRPPLPYEDMNLLRSLQHTVWFMSSIDSCLAMKDLLEAQHNTFYHDYNVLLVAGTKAGIGEKALPPVTAAIGKVPQDTKTITLSCGKLLTGVTIPAWGGILMLRELKSPETYFQAAFRVQSPWTGKIIDPVHGGHNTLVYKENCYVLDFSPMRALELISNYTARLRADLPSERNDEEAVADFIEFLPVLSFDGATMRYMDASEIISYLVTSGVTAGMLVSRWQSFDLIALSPFALDKLLEDEHLLESLEEVESWRGVTKEAKAIVSRAEELEKTKKDTTPPDPKEEKHKDTEDKKHRESLKKKLHKFITRIPVFMYLTDDREKCIRDIILQDSTGLFQRVTGLSLADFEKLVNTGVFNNSKMNDAVWKFRMFEDPSLSYDSEWLSKEKTWGGWDTTATSKEVEAALVLQASTGPSEVVEHEERVEDLTVSVVSDEKFDIEVSSVSLAEETEKLIQKRRWNLLHRAFGLSKRKQ